MVTRAHKAAVEIIAKLPYKNSPWQPSGDPNFRFFNSKRRWSLNERAQPGYAQMHGTGRTAGICLAGGRTVEPV